MKSNITLLVIISCVSSIKQSNLGRKHIQINLETVEDERMHRIALGRFLLIRGGETDISWDLNSLLKYIMEKFKKLIFPKRFVPSFDHPIFLTIK